MKGRLDRPVTGYHLMVTLVACASLAAATLFVSLTVNSNSERKFCTVAREAIDQAELQASGLDQSPPTTPAGVAIREGWRRSVINYKTLYRDLGCLEAAK